MTPRLQEWIYRFEVGEGVKTVRGVFAVLALLGLTVLYDLREYKNFFSPESMDTAQLAANVADGHGLVTFNIRPLGVHLLQQRMVSQGQSPNKVLQAPVPDVTHPPVYPMLLGLAMKVLPFRLEIPNGALFERYQPEVLIALLNQALFFLCIWVVFRLSKTLFDEVVAWMAAAILAGCELFWRFSVSGLSTIWLLLLWLLLIWCLVKFEEGTRAGDRTGGWHTRMAIAVGGLLGLGVLTRYGFGWLAIPVVGYMAYLAGPRRLPVVVTTATVFLLLLIPWVIRNYQLSGAPFGTAGFVLLADTEFFPGNRLERLLSPDFSRIDFEVYLRKLVLNVAEIMRTDLPKLGGSWVSAFFLVGLLMPFRSPALRRLRVFVLAAAIMLGLVQALGRSFASTAFPEVNLENYLVLLVPLVFLFGTAMFLALMDQIEIAFPPMRTVANATFCLVSSASLIFTLLPPRSFPHAYPPYWPPLVQQLSNWMRPGELMMSDMPWAVAWYGRKPCLWTVLDVERDFYAINDYQKPVSALYLTQLTSDSKFYSEMFNNPDKGWEWFILQSMLRTNVPPGFPLKVSTRGFPSGQLYLTDHERWERAEK